MNTPTEKLVMALRVLATDIQSDDGVTNAALFEASLRLEQLSEKIMRLREGLLEQNQNIEQTCGKVLAYPWFKDDQKNFPGATEKDGVCVGDHVAETIVSELAKKHAEALSRIKRLEEALESIQKYWNLDNNEGAMNDACWHAINTASKALKAKEAKL
jgi:uncharacterized protein (UPF0218 family)